jgi:hypothetical protein
VFHNGNGIAILADKKGMYCLLPHTPVPAHRCLPVKPTIQQAWCWIRGSWELGKSAHSCSTHPGSKPDFLVRAKCLCSLHKQHVLPSTFSHSGNQAPASNKGPARIFTKSLPGSPSLIYQVRRLYHVFSEVFCAFLYLKKEDGSSSLQKSVICHGTTSHPGLIMRW